MTQQSHNQVLHQLLMPVQIFQGLVLLLVELLLAEVQPVHVYVDKPC